MDAMRSVIEKEREQERSGAAWRGVARRGARRSERASFVYWPFKTSVCGNRLSFLCSRHASGRNLFLSWMEAGSECGQVVGMVVPKVFTAAATPKIFVNKTTTTSHKFWCQQMGLITFILNEKLQFISVTYLWSHGVDEKGQSGLEPAHPPRRLTSA